MLSFTISFSIVLEMSSLTTHVSKLTLFTWMDTLRGGMESYIDSTTPINFIAVVVKTCNVLGDLPNLPAAKIYYFNNMDLHSQLQDAQIEYCNDESFYAATQRNIIHVLSNIGHRTEIGP